jgi:cystathionine beta-lyase
MRYNFDAVITRTGTSSVKWDYARKIYRNEDLLPMWVADMDFPVCSEIIDALKNRLEHPVFGYTVQDDEHTHAVAMWNDERHNWNIDPANILYAPGVVPAITILVHRFSSRGEGIIVQPPVYYPFFNLVSENGRELVENPLVYNSGHCSMDIPDLLSKIDKNTRLLLLCNPHNPAGRVWTKDELTTLAEICIDNNILVISDEIHSDLVFSPNIHTPLASLGPEIADLTITLTSPTKTFNLAGLPIANMIISSSALRDKAHSSLENSGIHGPGVFEREALVAAYTHGKEWLDQCLDYIADNFAFVNEYLSLHAPGVSFQPPQGTYLGWMDISSYSISDAQLQRKLIKEGNVWISNGATFGKGGEGFLRINVATSRITLEEGLSRLCDVLSNV